MSLRFRERTRLGVEALEDRAVPAVTASVVHGSLVVVGDPSAASHVSITASDTNADKVADSFKITDGTKVVGTFGGVTQDIILKMGKEDDAVTIDLGGLSAPHEIKAYLGDGSNALSLINGTVAGSLSVHGGDGANAVTLGGTAALTVNGHVNVQLDGPGNGSLELKGLATVKGDLMADHVSSVKLDAGSAVGKNAIDHGGPGVDSLNVAGTVGGNVIFQGGKQADTLNVTGTIGDSLFASLGQGSDAASVGGKVGGSVVLHGGTGKDTLTLNGTVGGHTMVFGGGGGDSVTVAATAHLMKRAEIQLGTGNDTFTLNGSAVFPSLVARGGRGKDSFVGNKTQTGLQLVGF
jgi:fibronectin-binding autotransporter adhesin